MFHINFTQSFFTQANLNSLNHVRLSHLSLLLVALIYGANYSIAKVLMDPGVIGPNAFIFYRVCVSALLFFLLTRSLFSFERKDFGLLLVCTFSGVVGNQLLFFNGLKNTSPIHAALIMVCTPLLVLLIKTATGTKLQIHQWLGCAIGLLGAAYLITHRGTTPLQEAGTMGDLMVLVNALLYGYYLIKVPELVSRYDPFKVLTALFSLSILPVGLMAIPQLMEFQVLSLTMDQWMAFLFVLVATTFLAYALNTYALKHTNAETVSMYIYLQPLCGTMIAIGLGHDRWQPHYGLSTCLIFGGLYLSGKKNLKF